MSGHAQTKQLSSHNLASHTLSLRNANEVILCETFGLVFIAESGYT